MSTLSSDLRLPASVGPRPSPIAALTGLRFVAALHVLLYHLWIFFPAAFAGVPGWAMHVTQRGYLGVPLFFVLSGFVMAVAYLPAGAPAPDARRYWRARFARIYPVYGLSLLVSAPCFLSYKLPGLTGAWSGAKTLLNALLHASLLQAWYPRIILDWNPPAWSLSVEAFFYLMFPLLVGPLGLTRLDRRQLQRMALGLWVVSLGLTIGTLWILQGHPGLDPKEIGGFRCVLPLLRLPDFMMGIAVGRLYLLTRPDERLVGLFATGGAIALGLAMALAPATADHNLMSSLMLPLYGLMLFGLAHQRGGLGAVLGSPRMRHLGEASYSLYILHWPLLGALQLIAARWVGPHGSMALGAVLAIGASLFSYRYVELPCRDRLKAAPR